MGVASSNEGAVDDEGGGIIRRAKRLATMRRRSETREHGPISAAADCRLNCPRLRRQFASASANSLNVDLG